MVAAALRRHCARQGSWKGEDAAGPSRGRWRDPGGRRRLPRRVIAVVHDVEALLLSDRLVDWAPAQGALPATTPPAPAAGAFTRRLPNSESRTTESPANRRYAGGGTRTLIAVRPPAPKAGVSTDSTTPADRSGSGRGLDHMDAARSAPDPLYHVRGARVAEWQTLMPQKHLLERACGFESHPGH